VFAANGIGGAYAEYVAVKPVVLARKPSNLSFEEAASVPVAAQTAWQGIFTHGHLEKGQTILIHVCRRGGRLCGAIGIACRATVIATASGGDEAYLKSIGAGRVIDIGEAQFEKVLREKVDVVFDLIGGDTQKRSFLVLKEGGHLVAATQPVSPEEAARHRVSGEMMRLAPSATCWAESRDCWKRAIRPDSRPCTRCRMRPRPGRTSREPARVMGRRPVGRERQNAGHTARSCYVGLDIPTLGRFNNGIE